MFLLSAAILDLRKIYGAVATGKNILSSYGLSHKLTQRELAES